MSQESSREFKIDEKIAAIKRTMLQLGSSIKAGGSRPAGQNEGLQEDNQQPRVLKNSYSMEDLKSGTDLLTSPFDTLDSQEADRVVIHAPTDRGFEGSKTPVPPLRLSDAFSSNKQSMDLTRDKRGMEGKSPEIWELSVLLDYERDKVTALEQKISAREKIISELKNNQDRLVATVQNYREEAADAQNRLEEERNRWEREASRSQQDMRLAQDKLERVQQNLESLLEKHKSLETYTKELEARRDVEDLATRTRDLEEQRVSLLTENAQYTQRLQTQDRELDLMKSTAEQLRTRLKEADKALNIKEQEIVELKREKVGLLKEIDTLQLRFTEKQGSVDRKEEGRSEDVRALRTENVRLVRELKERPSADANRLKDQRIDHLLAEIHKLRSEKVRPRSNSAGKIEKAPVPKRTKRAKSQGGRKPSVPYLRRKESVESHALTTRRTPPNSQFRELMDMLKVTDTEELVQTCVGMVKEMAAHKKFAGNLAILIRDCSPPDSFPKSPSFKQMWKWVKRLVEEYMLLRKTNQEEINHELRTLLKVKSNQDLVRAAIRQTADLQSMSSLIEKLKTVLGLDPKVGLESIDEALSTILANPSA